MDIQPTKAAAENKHKHDRINDAINYLYSTIHHVEEVLGKITGEDSIAVKVAAEGSVKQPCLIETLEDTPNRLMEIKEILEDRLNKIEQALF